MPHRDYGAPASPDIPGFSSPLTNQDILMAEALANGMEPEPGPFVPQTSADFLPQGFQQPGGSFLDQLALALRSGVPEAPRGFGGQFLRGLAGGFSGARSGDIFRRKGQLEEAERAAASANTSQLTERRQLERERRRSVSDAAKTLAKRRHEIVKEQRTLHRKDLEHARGRREKLADEARREAKKEPKATVADPRLRKGYETARSEWRYAKKMSDDTSVRTKTRDEFKSRLLTLTQKMNTAGRNMVIDNIGRAQSRDELVLIMQGFEGELPASVTDHFSVTQALDKAMQSLK